MNRVLAEGVFKAVWPWGHNRKEAVGTEFLQAQGRDYDCFPFRVILSVLSFWQWHFYFVVRHIRVLFSTDVAAMGVDTPDLNSWNSFWALFWSKKCVDNITLVAPDGEAANAITRIEKYSWKIDKSLYKYWRCRTSKLAVPVRQL